MSPVSGDSKKHGGKNMLFGGRQQLEVLFSLKERFFCFSPKISHPLCESAGAMTVDWNTNIHL